MDSLKGLEHETNSCNEEVAFLLDSRPGETPRGNGIHTNTQEGLWYHVKKSVLGTRDLELALIDFMFKRRFNARSDCKLFKCLHFRLVCVKIYCIHI